VAETGPELSFRELVAFPLATAPLQHRGRSISVIHSDAAEVASAFQRDYTK